ncbi:hypothetical protein HII36_54095 [Nonomuraea sp. NN258]|uniref:hypothetical protein n=1 Tax=Nonomuraea antri TaxID=2730852 RepID=UPI001568B643|nr:hypothetical protein [Nonomuraea antri]NRQ40688.1 hypothetical protein [Nonomuraea antri]
MRGEAVRFAVLLGGEWADLSSHVMTERDIQIAEARKIIRDYLDQREQRSTRP